MEKIVVKVGGSLYDMPDLGLHLRRWLDELNCRRVILLPGGGRLADAVRELDRVHRLGEDKSHWLALRTLTCNAHFLCEVLPGSCVAASIAGCAALQDAGIVPIIDAYRFCEDDESQPDHLPHTWEVTSDSIAARIAVCWQARLILLKSTTIPAGTDWTAAAQAGCVDAMFSRVARTLHVECVNLRERTEVDHGYLT